jgi:hypothetical protein
MHGYTYEKIHETNSDEGRKKMGVPAFKQLELVQDFGWKSARRILEKIFPKQKTMLNYYFPQQNAKKSTQ